MANCQIINDALDLESDGDSKSYKSCYVGKLPKSMQSKFKHRIGYDAGSKFSALLVLSRQLVVWVLATGR